VRLALCLVLLAVLVPGSAFAAQPAGPRLATVSLSDVTRKHQGEKDPSRLSLRTVGPSGAQLRRLLDAPLEPGGGEVGPMPFNGPRWSAEGSLLAFAGSSGKGKRIYVIGADGSGLRPVAGTKNGTEPVLSPDGHTVAFSRTRFRAHINVKDPIKTRFYSSATTWIGDLGGGRPHRLTDWRNGLESTPGSFSPDGSVLAMTVRDDRLDGPRVTLTPLDGRPAVELIQLGAEPAFSPDGSRVAFVGYGDRDTVHAEENHDYAAGEIYTMGVDGSGLKRLTRSKGILESSPSWDPSGQRLAFVRARGSTGFVPELDGLFPFGNAIAQVNADGSCATEVLSLRRVALYGVAWQPGPGREAGPISC
jgi:Tol biopolymer transport system component